MKRALRRHHRQRIIRKFQRIYKNWDYENWEENGLHTASRGSIRCGCWMCKNPRRLPGQTYNERYKVQERRADIYKENWESEHRSP